MDTVYKEMFLKNDFECVQLKKMEVFKKAYFQDKD